MKKILIVVALIVALLMPACTRGGADKINKKKTQLYIGVFDGGIGDDWVYAAKKRFEKKYENHSFEDGKMGVEVRSTPSRSFTATGMTENIGNMTDEIIFAEGASSIFFSKRGDFLDISDVVTQPLNYDFVAGKLIEGGENVTIQSKLSQNQIDYFTAVDNAYYALPAVKKFHNIAYDIELFEKHNLFFAPDGSFVTSKEAARSAGPDMDADTEFDNGLPATYDQFFELCDKIASIDNLIPVMWGSTVQEYVSSLLSALQADFEGAQQMELNYNYSGTLNRPVASFDNNGNPVIGSPLPITAATGYQMYKQEGRYHALKFLERLTSNAKYYNSENATSNAFTHQDAEGVFVSAKYSSKLKRPAMLIDGNWWQSEARGVFNELAAIHGEEASMKNRKFGLMPLPKVSSQHTNDGVFTILQSTGDIAFIRKGIAEFKINLAKSFLQFCYTEESLREFTVITNMCRPVSYEMGERFDELSTWGKTMVDIHKYAETAYRDSDSLIMQNYPTDLWYSPRLWMSTVGGKTYTYPTFAMINDGVSARNYFNGLSAYWTPTVWSNKFKLV